MASQSSARGKFAMAATPSSWVARCKDPTGFMARRACGEHCDVRGRSGEWLRRVGAGELRVTAMVASVRNCDVSKVRLDGSLGEW